MKLKRIMAMVLCFAMVLSTMSFNVFAATNYLTAADVFPAADADGVITLVEDITLPEDARFSEELKINLNGNALNLTTSVTFNGSATLYGGTINANDVSCPDGIIRADYHHNGEPAVTLKLEDVTVNANNVEYGTGLFYVEDENDILVLSDVEVVTSGANEDPGSGVFYSASSFSRAKVILDEGTTVTSDYSSAIFFATDVELNGATITCSNVRRPVFRQAAGTVKDSTITVNSIGDGQALVADVSGNNFGVVNFVNSTVTAPEGTPAVDFSNDGSAAKADSTSSVGNNEGVLKDDDTSAEKIVATVNGDPFTDLQEAIVAAAPNGTVEIVNDVTVDEWKMFWQGDRTFKDIIYIDMDGLTINGHNHTLTVNKIVSATNGDQLFKEAKELNINDLTINIVNGSGIGLESGSIKNVTITGGGYGIFPGEGNITIEGCDFATNSTAIYYEAARDNLVVTGCEFNQPDGVNVILLHGKTTFTNNVVNSGRTVNVASGSPIVTGNNFNDVRLKVYNEATATIENNEINVLAFNDESTVNSTFGANTLSDDAQAVLDAADFGTASGLVGTGEKEDPYLINNIEDLVWFRNDVNAGNTYEGKHVLLTADIDFEGYEEMNVNHEGNNVSSTTFRPIGDTSCNASFKGTFDGGNNTISNLYISGWDINYHWYNYGSAGLFGTVENATIKNLTMAGVEIQVEGGDVAAIAGHAIGDCTFENITVTESKIATYNNGCASIVAWSDAGNYTFKDIEITDSVVLAGLWGSFDSSIGGVLAQADNNATYLFEDVTVACRLDIYNDVTASYKYYLYRMCGMLIGRSTRFIEGTSEVNADNITCKNVNITIGEWANYTYIWDDTLSYGCKRVEPGYTYDGIDVAQYPDAEITMQPMTSIIGGGQYGYSGSTAEELANQGFDESELQVEDLAFAARYDAKIGDTYYSDLHEAMVACKAGETVVLISDVDLAGIEWEPVSFKGTFDGQDHVISNLTINKPGVSNTGFITSLNGTFKNVTFTNPTVTGGENTGVVAGRAGGGAALAENITVNGTIKVETTHSGYARAGVIVGGWAYGNYKDITVDGGDKAESYIKHTGGGDGRYVGGIVGHADDVESYVNCTVKNITISSENGGWLCGGIAGPGPADGVAFGCTVENVNIGADYSGGLFGWYYGDGTIENSTIKDVAFTAGTTKNGAIGGYSLNPDATVTNVTIENVTNGNAALLEHVVKVNDTYYFDFEDGIEDAIEAGGDITLLADFEPSETIKFTNNITLDLNGKTISGTCNVSQAHLFMVNNGATMTIKDSSAAQTGIITYAGDNSTGWIVDVEGKLVLESGTLELTGTWGIGYAVDVRPNAWGTAYTEETAFVMNGGKIISSDGAVRVASSSSDTYKDVSASFTMNGGEIDAAWDGVFVQQSNAAWDVLNVTINDGTIKSGLNPIRFYGPAATSYVNGEDCVDIELNGGTLTYTGTETQQWLIDGILRLGGGVTADEFTKDSDVIASASFASANVADGYSWVSIGRRYRLQALGEYSFVLEAAPDEIIDSGSFNVEVKVSSEKVDDFYSAEYIITYDTTLLTCEEDDGTFDYDKTPGTLRLQYFGEENKNDVNEVMSTLNFTTKDFYLTHETEIKVTGTVCATQYDAAVGSSESVEDGMAEVLLKDSFVVTVGAGLEGADVAYNKTDYVVSVAAENQGKQNTVKYTIKDADGNPVEYSVILPAGTNEYKISGEAIVGDMTFEIADAYSIEIITDYVTGYALILVDGTADGYTYNGHQMFKISCDHGTCKYDGRYGWLVDGTAEGTSRESVEAAAYAAIRAGGESKAVERGYDVNSYINGDGMINFYDVSAAYACQKVDFALSDIDDYYYMELYLASDTNCDGKVDSSDSAVISVNYN